MELLGRRAECEVLDRVLADARAGRSRAVVLRGEAGAGKSALLDYVSGRLDGWRVGRAVGVESEMELPYSSLHQLCAGGWSDRLDRLPHPQRDALATVFGLSAGPAPDRFLVGLATLTLFSEIAEEEPLVCVVDDAHWLDEASAQILGFVARRLLAERVALVFAARTGDGDDVFAGLPELSIAGLGESDARALLQQNVQGPFDAAIGEQIIAESHGNPLALLELPRTWGAADVAGGFAVLSSQPVMSKIEESYAKRLSLLPADTRLLILAAAAEPLGDPLLLHRAVEILGLSMSAAGPAVDGGLLKIGPRIEFAHPLVRTAAYHSAGSDDRHHVHHALAEATDPERDPDRRAWHRARATRWPDEDVAAELERSAGRAQARGGLAAAAAFLERAAALSPDPAKRARRSLDAAEAKELAGAPQAASALLAAALDGPLDERESALALRLKGQIALDQLRVGEAVPLLLEAACRLEPIEPGAARDTYLEAMRSAQIAGRYGGEMLRRAAEAARAASPPPGLPGAYDVLMAGMAVRYTDGYAPGAVLLKQALRALREEEGRVEQNVRWPGFGRAAALDLFDDEACEVLAVRSVELARERGALGALPLALDYLALLRSFQGNLDGATAVLEESNTIAEATGTPRIEAARLVLTGLRGDEAALSELLEAVDALIRVRRSGTVLTFGELGSALLYNGLGRYEAALAKAESASARNELTVSTWSLPELVEAAARSGRGEVAAEGLERLSERTQAAGTDLALGIEARSRALLAEGEAADELYREAVDRLSRCRFAPDQARAHLLYGEWLRREGKRTEAREQLHAAHDMLAAIGMQAFAERTRRELLATGEKARRRTDDTRGDLTAQEAQIAELARDGYSNPEIGAQLFLSPRTVEWHLHKVFTKLDIGSRKELEAALRTKVRQAQPA